MTPFLCLLGAAAVQGVLLLLLPRRARARRRAALQTGALRCPARLSLPADGGRSRFGRRSRLGRRGRLEHTGRATTWTALGRSRQVVALTGLRLQSASVAADSGEHVQLTGRAGLRTVRLRLAEADGAALVSLLGRAPDAGWSPVPAGLEAETAVPEVAEPYPGEPWAGTHLPPSAWPRRIGVLLVAGSLCWLIGWNYLTVVGGDRVTATVTANDGEDYCQVVWTLGGRGHGAGVDCGDERPGAALEIWALPQPFFGEAVDVAFSPWFFAAIGWAGTFGGAWLVRPRRPRPDDGVDLLGSRAGSDPGPLPPELLEEPARTARELMTRLHPYALAQVPDDWEDPANPAGAAPRRPWVDVLQVLGGTVAALAVLAFFVMPAPYRATVLATSGTATTTAVATDEVAIDGAGPWPAEQTVRLKLPDGSSQDADVLTTRSLETGSVVEVDYAVDRPGWARLTGSADGLDRALWISAAGVTLVCLVAGGFLLAARRRHRAIAAALSGRTRPAIATLTCWFDGEPLVLLADEAITPPVLLVAPVALPLPLGTRALLAGGPLQVQALGRLAADEVVVLRLGEHLLQPAGTLWEPDAEDLHDLLDTTGALARSDP